MKFFVEIRVPYQGQPTFILSKDNWNDWFKWYRMFSVRAIMPDGPTVELGSLKIGRKGMTEEAGRTQLPEALDALDTSLFSLGQSENYYETLASLGADVRSANLIAMSDCAYSPDVLADNCLEPVMNQSMLRDIGALRTAFLIYRGSVSSGAIVSLLCALLVGEVGRLVMTSCGKAERSVQ